MKKYLIRKRKDFKTFFTSFKRDTDREIYDIFSLRLMKMLSFGIFIQLLKITCFIILNIVNLNIEPIKTLYYILIFVFFMDVYTIVIVATVIQKMYKFLRQGQISLGTEIEIEEN